MTDAAAEPPPLPPSKGNEAPDLPPVAETKPLDEPTRPLPSIETNQGPLGEKDKELKIPSADVTPAPPDSAVSNPERPAASSRRSRSRPSAAVGERKPRRRKPIRGPNRHRPPIGSIEPPAPALGAPSVRWSEPTAPPPMPPARPEAPTALAPVVIQISQVGEPPLAGMGPVQAYQVRTNGETLRDIARRTLGAGERGPTFTNSIPPSTPKIR